MRKNFWIILFALQAVACSKSNNQNLDNIFFTIQPEIIIPIGAQMANYTCLQNLTFRENRDEDWRTTETYNYGVVTFWSSIDEKKTYNLKINREKTNKILTVSTLERTSNSSYKVHVDISTWQLEQKKWFRESSQEDRFYEKEHGSYELKKYLVNGRMQEQFWDSQQNNPNDKTLNVIRYHTKPEVFNTNDREYLGVTQACVYRSED